MDKKIVVLVEPSFYGVNYVREAKKLDCFVVVVVSDKNNPQVYGYNDLYDDMLVCDIRDPESIYHAIKGSKYKHIDALISATDYAIANTSKAAEKLGLKYLSYGAAQCVRNKDIARQCYADNHVPSARFSVVRTMEQAEEAALKIGFPVVLKPTNCASSQHVFFIDNVKDLYDAFKEMKSFMTTYMGFQVREDYLVEEYLDGPEFSVEIFVEDGQVIFSELTEKITTALPFFVENYHIFPSSIMQLEKPSIIDVAAQALNAIGLVNGPAHVEVKYTTQGPKIVEVNGRPGGDNITSDLIPTAYHIDIFRQTVRNLLGLPVDFNLDNTSSSAIGFICANKEGILESIVDLDKLEEDESVVRYSIDAKVGDKVRVPESSDDRLGYVIVNIPTPEQAKNKIINIINSIKVNIKSKQLVM